MVVHEPLVENHEFSHLTGSGHVLTSSYSNFGQPKKKGESEEKIRVLVPISRIMLRCMYGCQKWIPDKILHRYDDPIFFSTFFSMKKNILRKKMKFSGKYFFQ